MNLQVKHNDLINRKKMIEYKLSTLGIARVIQKRKLNTQLVEINARIEMLEEAMELASSDISSEV